MLLLKILTINNRKIIFLHGGITNHFKAIRKSFFDVKGETIENEILLYHSIKHVKNV